MTRPPAPTGSHGYDEVAADRVRRTLRAVADTVPPAPDMWSPDIVGRPRLEASPSGRARWWAGAAAVGVVAAGLVTAVAIAGRSAPLDPTAPADPIGPAGPGRDLTLDAPAAGPANGDVMVPGVVPDGLEYRGFRVLDPLPGSIEVDVYVDGGDVVAGFVTDDPATADRLAERTDLWGDVTVAGPMLTRSDGYLAFSRGQSSEDAVTDDLNRLIDDLGGGLIAEDVAPEGFELAASTVTAELPEAGRLVQVEYGSETATLRLATRQGTLDPALAAHLYAGAEPTTVRGQPGFAAEDGQLLVWQETSGLVASITSSGVGRTTVDDFVDGLHTVTEDAWVVLRTAGDAGERTLDTPAQPESAGTEGGFEYRIEAFERGSLDTGLESCRRLVVVGATEPTGATRCGPAEAPSEVPVDGGRLVWTETADGHSVEFVEDG